jgi:hypothetical protein
MSANTRAKEIEELRERLKPDDFDAWVCLGRDYRDQAEVQECASSEEAQELSLAYTAFREKLEYNTMIEKADEAQARQWFRGEQEQEQEQEQECYWCEDNEGVTLVKSYQLYGCRECAGECGSD